MKYEKINAIHFLNKTQQNDDMTAKIKNNTCICILIHIHSHQYVTVK